MDGVLSESNIGKQPHLFLAYQLHLVQRLGELRSKATFQIIPQMTMKRRCVTFGKNELTDLLCNLPDNGGFLDDADVRSVRTAERMERAAKKKPHEAESNVEMVRTRKRKQPSPPADEVKAPTHDQIEALWEKTYRKVFICSNKKWNGVVTTDGVVASWHMEGEKPTKTKPEKKNKNKFKTGTIVNELQNKMYGTHGANDVLLDLKKPFNIIAVDPGHEVLIDSVRLHKTDAGLQQLPAKGSSRRKAKFQFLQKERKSTFRLTNK
jgi:hypothetical protein